MLREAGSDESSMVHTLQNVNPRGLPYPDHRKASFRAIDYFTLHEGLELRRMMDGILWQLSLCWCWRGISRGPAEY